MAALERERGLQESARTNVDKKFEGGFMKRFTFSAMVSVLGATSLAATVLAQTPPPTGGQQTPPPAGQQAPPRTAAEPQASARADQDQVTVTGCVVKEADYRQAKDAGKGGAAGTGIGAGNEYILVNASRGGATGGAPGATGTAGSTASTGSAAYELTGSGEGQAGTFVGKRVEIIGKLKAAEMSPAGRPTGRATAGEPPRGIDVASKDIKLRELEVSSVREAAGSCPQR
jgi:hypothetical protein